MARLTDLQRQMIIADLSMGATVRALAAKYNVSATTIQRLKNSNQLEVKQAIEAQHQENTKSIRAHMESQKEQVCNLLDILLASLFDPKKIEAANIAKTATTMAILMDKYLATEKVPVDNEKENNLFKAVQGISEVRIDLDNIPELCRQLLDMGG